MTTKKNVRESKLASQPMLPSEIKAAVNALIQPYGMDFEALFNPQPEPNDALADKKCLNYKQAANYAGVSRFTLHRAVNIGELSAFKLCDSKNGKVLFRISDLDDWLMSKQIKKEVM